MDSFEIRVKSSVEKDLRRLQKTLISRILEEIENLRSDPFPHGAIKLSGSDRLYRIRIGDYRIIYEGHEQSRVIVIQYISHRRSVYRPI